MKASNRLHARLMCAASALALTLGTAAHAEVRQFDIPAGSLGDALAAFGMQSDLTVVTTSDITRSKSSQAIAVAAEPETALAQLLGGTGLTYRREGDTFLIVRADGPQGGSAAGGGAEVEALIVTAQKREEDIQDVPIAMSAFTQEALTTHQIAGGPDLMTQIPNFTFTKTNFSGYSIQIRGIGTQAVSATVDPAVAVAFNNTPFIRNRFFEQEFYDLQRVEVLRGPQGTLYGRNATAGVVNLITRRPRHDFEAKLSADVSNYSSTRLEGMVNIPLVEDVVALRLAGAWTKRDGYVTNIIDGTPTDGRDLWSTRLTLGFEPTDAISAYLTWEHFEEDDDRLRTGKQLCTRHIVPDWLPQGGSVNTFSTSSYTSQGCQMGSLYEADAFQVPNGYALPYWGPLQNLSIPIRDIDPYLSTTQSRDLREIETSIEPEYNAKTDILHLALEVDLTDDLTFTSETGYTADELFSLNDYNRFNTRPGVFTLGNAIYDAVAAGVIDENLVFCDPQLGCSDRLVAADVSTARSDQFSQEFRLSSAYDGPFNFHVGANFLRYDTVDKYYVFVNTLSMYSVVSSTDQYGLHPYVPGMQDITTCLAQNKITDPDNIDESPSVFDCTYTDPNPIGSLNDYGRNYFLSKNPFRLISYALFGEMQYEITEALKLTAGLRFTVDKKHSPIIPTWLLTGQTYGLPTKKIIDQEWREPTGRLVLDWSPVTGFTDETMVYASYARGYKAGGVNPPLPGGLPLGDNGIDFILATQPETFDAEFVDAYEFGTKNTLLDGRMTFNANLFYYDYKNYQISQIANRSAINHNLDAEVWGAELEIDWRPLENLKIGFRGGYEKTRIGDGESMIDMIDRTAGDPDWAIIKPFPSYPSNCIGPRWYLENYAPLLGLDGFSQFCKEAYVLGLDPFTRLAYEADPTVTGGGVPIPAGYPGFNPAAMPNFGAGFSKDLSGNELPNAPDFTTTLTVDYTLLLPQDWLLTLHADLYRQSEAWTRVFNEDPYDKLEPFEQVNLAAIFTNEDAGWKVMAYIKNVFDKDNITGAFLNSDDSALTTNVFLNEPRLYGLRVTKEWTGGGLFDGFAASKGPFPLTVELGGGPLRVENDDEVFRPGWSDEFTSPDMPIPFGVQNEDLDWGDSREVKIAYRPVGGQWNASLGTRFGRTNGTALLQNTEEVPGGWAFNPNNPMFAQFEKYFEGSQNYANSEEKRREEHTIVDFSVGRDFGLGFDSTVSAGLRYANFKSANALTMYGMPDLSVPPYYAFLAEVESQTGKYQFAATMHQHAARTTSERSFEGTGPVLSWEASRVLAGRSDTGRIALDWGLSGGLLFGKQKASVASEEESEYFRFSWPDGMVGERYPTSVAPPISDTFVRSEDVEVPVAGVSLGLSYEVGRVKIGAGYSFERYFDAMDGGIEEAKQYDRDLHGPYFKIAVGFGG